MESSETAPIKPLPAAIPQLQRILHRVEELKRVSVERIRAVLVDTDEREQGKGPRGKSTNPAGETELARILSEKIAECGAAFVFDEQLREVWPATPECEAPWLRARIYDFAGRHGWEAYVMNDSKMAMFRAAKNNATPPPSRS